MRICLLTRFFNRRNAGIGQYSQNLLAEMLRRGHEVDPVCTTRRGTIGYFLYTGAEIRFRIPRDVDVYHALTPLESIYLPKNKTVTTFHDLIPWLHRREETWYFSGAFGRFRRWFGGWWFKRACKKAAQSKRIICNSDQTKREIMENLKIPEEKITTIRLGISSDLKPLNVPHDKYRIGTLGYLDPRKRLHLAINAFKKLEDPNAELLIPGIGPDEGRLKKLSGGDKRIKFIGFIDESDKANYLSSLDVLLHTSKLEGYGIPIIESLRCKTPVVTLSDAIIPEDVKSKTKVTDVKDLTDVLRERNFGENLEEGYKFSIDHSWEKCADETIKIYEGVAG